MKLLKKKLTFLVCYFTLSLANAQQSFTLNVKIAHEPDNAIAYLNYNNRKDSTKIVNGKFSFKGSLFVPVFAWIAISKNGIFEKEPYPLYLEPTIMTVTSPDSLRNAVVKGGELNDQENKFMALLTAATAKADSLSSPVKDAKERTKSKSQNPEDVDKNSRYELQKSVAESFMKNNPDALYDILIIKNLAGSDPDFVQIEHYFEGLSERVRNSEMAKRLKVSLNRLKTTALGEIAPEFAMSDTAGKQVSLKSFRGKYVLLEFWASWCIPCREENPNLVANYRIYHPKGLEVLAVSLDKESGRRAWLKAIADDHLPWTHVSDLEVNNEAARLYNINSIPRNYLIDPTGKIIAKNLRDKKLTEALNRIFK